MLHRSALCSQQNKCRTVPTSQRWVVGTFLPQDQWRGRTMTLTNSLFLTKRLWVKFYLKKYCDLMIREELEKIRRTGKKKKILCWKTRDPRLRIPAIKRRKKSDLGRGDSRCKSPEAGMTLVYLKIPAKSVELEHTEEVGRENLHPRFGGVCILVFWWWKLMNGFKLGEGVSFQRVDIDNPAWLKN